MTGGSGGHGSEEFSHLQTTGASTQPRVVRVPYEDRSGQRSVCCKTHHHAHVKLLRYEKKGPEKKKKSTAQSFSLQKRTLQKLLRNDEADANE